MNRRFIFVALAIVPIVGLFLAAREAASWRPKTISKAQFEASLEPERVAIDFGNDTNLPVKMKKIRNRGRSQGWKLRDISIDSQRYLVDVRRADNYSATITSREGLSHKPKSIKETRYSAIINAQDEHEIAHLQLKGQLRLDTGNANKHFSPDGQLIYSDEVNSNLKHVFDGHTGRELWNYRDVNNRFIFSPNGKFAAERTAPNNSVNIREARSGRIIGIMPFQFGRMRWNFSRDSNFLLAEVAPGQYRQLRLR